MKTTLTCLAAALCAVAIAQPSARYLAYIDTYAPLAVQEMHSVGIPASITIAQGLLESGAGSSTLATQANNHFGIKCHRDWTGKKMYRKDDDRNKHGKLIESCFRSYDHPAQSYADHSLFLTSAPRYASLFSLDAGDYKAWARGLKKAGYATSKTYATKLIGIIETYELHKYDTGNVGLLVGNTAPVPPANSRVPAENTTISAARPALTGAAEPLLAATKAKPAVEAKAIVHNINDVDYTYPLPGETLGDIARRTRRYSADLVDYNESIANAASQVPAGMRVYLQPKRKAFRGRSKTHRVRERETMQSIADHYALKTEALYSRNRMSPGTQPRTGEDLVLRGRRKKSDQVKVQTQRSRSRAAVAATALPDDKVAVAPAHRRTVAAKASTEVADTPSHITVGAGDTLYSISRRTGVSVDRLRQLNQLSSATIHVGQRLRTK